MESQLPANPQLLTGITELHRIRQYGGRGEMTAEFETDLVSLSQLIKIVQRRTSTGELSPGRTATSETGLNLTASLLALIPYSSLSFTSFAS